MGRRYLPESSIKGRPPMKGGWESIEGRLPVESRTYSLALRPRVHYTEATENRSSSYNFRTFPTTLTAYASWQAYSRLDAIR